MSEVNELSKQKKKPNESVLIIFLNVLSPGKQSTITAVERNKAFRLICSGGALENLP